eukprot:1157817-Pelagomonas_calceolata.AAC.25
MDVDSPENPRNPYNDNQNLPRGMAVPNHDDHPPSTAEQVVIAAAILQGHSHIATNSLSSLHQIRKQVLYPELYRQHVRGHILEITMLYTLYSLCAIHERRLSEAYNCLFFCTLPA